MNWTEDTMNKTARVCVIHGMLGITFLYLSLIQGQALAGFDFGDVPILQGWLGGIIPTGAGALAALFLRSALFRKNGNGQ